MSLGEVRASVSAGASEAESAPVSNAIDAWNHGAFGEVAEWADGLQQTLAQLQDHVGTELLPATEAVRERAGASKDMLFQALEGAGPELASSTALLPAYAFEQQAENQAAHAGRVVAVVSELSRLAMLVEENVSKLGREVANGQASAQESLVRQGQVLRGANALHDSL